MRPTYTALKYTDALALLKKGEAQCVLPQEQFRFPRSKKKRIQKKWANDPRNFRPWSEGRQYHLVTRDFEQREKSVCPCCRIVRQPLSDDYNQMAEQFETWRKKIAIGLGISPEVLTTHTGREYAPDKPETSSIGDEVYPITTTSEG